MSLYISIVIIKKNLLYNLNKIILLLLEILTCTTYAQIRINEVCSSNKGNFYDEKFDTPDWIELYNYSNEPVNLSNWSISDQSDYSKAWQLPDTIIQPGEYFIVCASGRAINNAKSINIISNGVKNTHFSYEDQLSLAYVEALGDFSFEVEYNNFKGEINTKYEPSLAGVVIKEEIQSKSKMIGFFNNPTSYRKVNTHIRKGEEIYRVIEPIKDRIKIDENKHLVERKRDSIYYKVKDNNDNVIMSKGYFLPMKDSIFIGFTIITHSVNNYDSLSIKSLKLNGTKLNIFDFNNISFHHTDIETKEVEFSHSNFKLSSSHDSLFLFNEGIITERFDLPNLYSNLTYSKIDLKNQYYKFSTPGKYNGLAFENINEIDENFNKFIFLDDKIIFENIDSTYKYTNDLTIPYVDSEKLIDFESDTTNPLIVRRMSEDKADSKLIFTPLIDESKIKNNLLHFHLFTDSSYLFNEYTGIINLDFSLTKIPAYLAITKSNKKIFSGKLIIKKNGEYSNIDTQHASLRLIFDDDDYDLELSRNFFSTNYETRGNAVILRNGGNDKWTMLRSRFAYSLLGNTNLLSLEYNTAIVYINNSFWGVYHLRERIDDDYLADHHKVSKNEINSFEDKLQLKYGTPIEMIDFNRSLQNNQRNSYESMDSIIDIKNFIDYIFVHTFNIQHDWPHNNVFAYSYGEKWKFLASDMDYSYKLGGAGANINYISTVFKKNDNITTRILHNLLKSDKFVYDYINRSCDLMNTDFSSADLVIGFDSLANYFSQFRELQNNRWPKILNNWEEEVEVVRTFLRDRQSYYYSHLQTYFGKGPAQLNLTSFPNNAGSFRVNTLTIDKSQWSGNYLQNVPVTITAVPKVGYKFKKWNIDSLGSSASITTTLAETMNIIAIYEEKDTSEDAIKIVINEIMYNADKDKDTKDWIELYNAGTESVNLDGWSMIDEDDTHTPFVIGNDIIIEPNEYIIMTRSQTDFGSLINIENQVIGDLDYGFGGNDIVILKDADGNTHVSVNYDNDLPWPEGADGTGYSIELINPFLDNNVAGNWGVSLPELGTPGQINSVYDDSITSININNSNSEIDFIDKQLTIRSDIPIASISLFDLSGKKLEIDYNVHYNKAESDLNKINNGLYLLNIRYLNGEQETVKLIVN